MVLSALKKIFGTSNDRFIKSLQPIVDQINSLEESVSKLENYEFINKTEEFRKRIANGETLDDILPEAFALCREASKRTMGMRHFDVQLIGGIVLHRGMISEMRTGEGKTLVATLAAYLNALEGKGCHVVTVNDYLAQRDSQWMSKLYNFLGLSVGCITSNISSEERKNAYLSDITYGTNNEFGFDYLRDNMCFSIDRMTQRELHYAIVDEVDSILIDEARTPLIISGPAEDSSDLYKRINSLIPDLKKEDYEIDEKSKTINLGEDGLEKMENWMKKYGYIENDSSLYDMENISLVHHINQALRAHKLFNKDIDYIVKDDQIMIIDEFTGRMMEGRRYSEGLHQALEAKEGVTIQKENQTLASTSFQNYFRIYNKLAGMTGTATTEAEEFSHIYGLEVVEIPTHRSVSRIDEDDVIYLTSEEKYVALIEEIKEGHKKKQPFLIGTISIEKSEYISKLLKKEKISHEVLNAKHHEREAEIIAQAGRAGAVTIATNMAGRGTDIVLGGNKEFLIKELKKSITDESKLEDEIKKLDEKINQDAETVKAAGGLFVIGTERHESRRIDNQLRGRSGRQGDPGKTKFFLSMEDDLLRIFGAATMKSILGKLGMEKGEALNHPWISKAVARAQKKVEEYHYDIRKNLLKYDDVMNDQRTIIYDQRKQIMSSDNVRAIIDSMLDEINQDIISDHMSKGDHLENWDLDGMNTEIKAIYNFEPHLKDAVLENKLDEDGVIEFINKETANHIKSKREKYGYEITDSIEKKILLITLDEMWKNHLLAMDHLKQGINLRAYGQKDPLIEYKKESFLLFEAMLTELEKLTIKRISHIEIHTEAGSPSDSADKILEKKEKEQQKNLFIGRREAPQEVYGNNNNSNITIPIRKNVDANERNPRDPSSWGKIARNDPCPCGSDVKYKNCHGKSSS